MIELLTKNCVDEMLLCPEDYVDDTQDIALMRVCNETNNAALIMLGQDDDGKYYLVVDGDYSSYDVYPDDGENLVALLKRVLEKIEKEKGIV